MDREASDSCSNRGQIGKFLGRTLGVIILLAGAGLICCAAQTWEVRDYVAKLGYEPSEKIAAMRDDLELTKKAERIFAAAHPVLEGATSFNAHCANHNAEISLLGCYTAGQIYVYQIDRAELEGANRVTLAHELLHAVWARLGQEEKARLKTELNQVLADHQEWFNDELAAYTDEQRLEEVYTRAGTKLGDLPESLEQHYAEYFKNRGKIVAYYNQYQAPFNQLREKSEQLANEITAQQSEIASARATYEARAAALGAWIARFNACAEQPGCFPTDIAFRAERSELLTEQEAISDFRDEINLKIDAVNAQVVEYQQYQATLGQLSDAMNSNIIERIENEESQ